MHDVARSRKVYVYSNTTRLPKGADRWCTQMLAVVRAAKESTHPAANARTCVFIGDNYSENKNLEDLALAFVLIGKGYYDEVLFLFGPVGHTHNGVDADHKIHNQNCGAYTLCTLADLVNTFSQCWHDAAVSDRPSAAILQHQYNWKKWFKPDLQRLTGYVKTANNPHAIHAFRIRRHPSKRTIELHFQQTASLSGRWLGLGGQPDAEGFRLLRKCPSSVPELVVPRPFMKKETYAAEVTCPQMVQTLRSHGREDAVDWLRAVIAANGTIPIVSELEASRPAGELGRLITIGSGGHNATLRLMEPEPEATFWSLPERAICYDQRREAPLHHAPLRYAKKSHQLAAEEQAGYTPLVSPSRAKAKPKARRGGKVAKKSAGKAAKGKGQAAKPKKAKAAQGATVRKTRVISKAAAGRRRLPASVGRGDADSASDDGWSPDCAEVKDDRGREAKHPEDSAPGASGRRRVRRAAAVVAVRKVAALAVDDSDGDSDVEPLGRRYLGKASKPPKRAAPPVPGAAAAGTAAAAAAAALVGTDDSADDDVPLGQLGRAAPRKRKASADPASPAPKRRGGQEKLVLPLHSLVLSCEEYDTGDTGLALGVVIGPAVPTEHGHCWTVRPLVCRVPCTTKAAVTAAWVPQRSSATDEVHSYAVIAHFRKLPKNKKLPVGVRKDAVESLAFARLS